MIVATSRAAAFVLGAAMVGTARVRAPVTPGVHAAGNQRAACAQLARTALADTRIVSAAPVAAGRFVPPPTPFPPDLAQRAATLPAFCRVQAVATPTADFKIAVEIWLPLIGWHGRLLGIGNGGGAGAIPYWMGMIEGLKRGFAVATTERTFAWMVNFRRLNRDYERLAETLRALHVSAHAMTLLTRAMRDQRRGTRPKP